MRRIAAWLYGMRKIATGVVPVLLLCLLGEFVFDFVNLQLWVIIATLPPTLLFIGAYIPERPGRHWFGTSLLLLAFAVLSVVTAAMLVRTVGPGFRGQSWLVTFWIGLTFMSMVMRTWVLLNDQARDERGLGWRIATAWRWITRA